MLGGKLHNYSAAPQANSFPPKVGYQTVKKATRTVDIKRYLQVCSLPLIGDITLAWKNIDLKYVLLTEKQNNGYMKSTNWEFFQNLAIIILDC